MSILVHSSAIPVHSCGFLPIPADSCAIPADSSGEWVDCGRLMEGNQGNFIRKHLQVLKKKFFTHLNTMTCMETVPKFCTCIQI